MLGSSIKKARKTRDMTQEDLAGKLGVSRQAVCMWEQGRRDIKSKMLNKIARTLGITIDEMMKPDKFKRQGKEERQMRKTMVMNKIERRKVDFELMAPEAKKVLLAGDFNSWDEDGIALKKSRGGLWKTSLSLKPGRYEYKFIVDGQWWLDPANIDTINNTYGSLNSLKEVTV